MAASIKMPSHLALRGLSPSHIMLDGDPARPSQTGTDPNFRPCLLCQTVGWIKTPLGMR